ncbi:hypothetical protein [Mucilaginibacter sp. UR6-11]|uniref:hypothetical protein n=1 Tax=Mucilaginibacter sp. UR6-11 TaxID=1435644 RepID=UPI001E627CE3|nr:hypothetical protein [Mucilaginibacter sp. UR6-11]MCC8426624.1 hypothetical protein [Mucilaginibacter sp. UR6-11]
MITGINLWLDSYDDIYSDFDSRHYQARKISEDFLAELRVEIKNLPDTRNMILLLPAEMRNEAAEKIIAPGLHHFFTSQFRWHHNLYRQKLTKGLLFLIVGVMVMLLNSWIIFRAQESFIIICLKVLLEPAGWFLLWAGLDFLLYDLAGFKRTEHFYRALSEMKIYFQSSVLSTSATITNLNK